MAFDMFNSATMEEFGTSNDPSGKQTLILQTPTDSEPTVGDVPELNEFENYDILVETQKNNVQEVDRLSEVAEIILATESISHSQISGLLNQLASVTGEEQANAFKTAFEETVGPVGSFTSLPTQVNLEETKRFFVDQLGISKKQVDDAYIAFVSEQQKDFNELSEQLIFKLEGFINVQEAYSLTCVERLKRAIASKNFLVFVVTNNKDGSIDEKAMLDLRYINLSNRCLDAIQGDVLKLDLGQIEMLRTVLCSDWFQTVSSKIKRRDVSTFFPDNPYYTTTLDFNVRDSGTERVYFYNYVDILNLFSTGFIPAYFRTTILELQRASLKINNALAFFQNNGYDTKVCFEMQDRKVTFHEVVKDLNSYLNDISSLKAALTSITTASRIFETIAPVFDQVLSGYKSEQA